MDVDKEQDTPAAAPRKAAGRDGMRTEQAAARLRTLIVSGALTPGQRLSERVIAEQLEGVSRTPLREAFKILAAEGLLTLEPNRGAVITALSLAEVEAAIEVLSAWRPWRPSRPASTSPMPSCKPSTRCTRAWWRRMRRVT